MIAVRHGTDKASVHPVKGHGYTWHYEQFFKLWRNDNIKLLEIGVGGGESIRTWLEYFPLAKVIGVDTVQGTNEWNTVGAKPAGDRYHFVYGDQSDPTFLKCFVADYGSPPFEIIIDDGGHFSHQVVNSFLVLWPIVARGGFYCIEDIGCAYTPGTVFLTPGSDTHQKLFHDLFDSIHTGGMDVRQMSVTKELVILTKQ
jgi:hypothetical protein